MDVCQRERERDRVREIVWLEANSIGRSMVRVAAVGL